MCRPSAVAAARRMAQSLFDFVVKDAKGNDYALSQHKGKLVLVVNTASQCGFTPQYTGLEGLFQKYKDRGFVVIGFPCNQFGGQEPGDDDAIQHFVCERFKVSFPVLSKVDVNGSGEHPVFHFLKNHKNGGGWFGDGIKWNFTKFLVGRDGQPLARYAPTTKPDSIEKDIEANL